MPTQLDPDAVRLAKAIRQVETGNKPVRGASGELASRYQFMPDTWRASAKQVLGDENAPLTLENENKVAYTKIKQWKDQGLKASQIAAAWNAGYGSVKNDAWKNRVGVNSAGVKYDTPGYVNKVGSAYNSIKQSEGVQNNQPETPIQEPTPKKSILRRVGDLFTSGTQKFADTLGAAAAVATGVTRKIDEAKMQESESRFNLAKQLRTASPEQAAKIKSQLGQGTNLQTAVETIPALQKTNRQVFGEALATGLEATSGGLLGGGKGFALSKAVPEVAASSLKQAVGRGATTGAIYGGLSGAAQGLQDNKNLSGIVKSTALGGATGGLLGGTFGAAGYGITKLPKFAGNKAESIYKDVLKMTPTEQAREQAQGKSTPLLLKKLGQKGNLDNIGENVTNLLDEKEEKLSTLLKSRAKQSAAISVDDFEKSTKESLEKYKPHLAEYSSIKNKLDSIIASARENYGNTIGVDVANDIKRALWKDAFNPSGSQVVSDAIYEAGSAMKDLIEKAVPDADIAGMNKELGELIVASKQLSKSSTRKQSGIMRSRLGAIIGGVVGLPGGVVGSMTSAALGSKVDELLLSNVALKTQIASLLTKMEGSTPTMQKMIENQVVQLLKRHGIIDAARKAVQEPSTSGS